MFLITLASVLGPVAKASRSSTTSFTYGFVWGSIEFPEETHPLDTITCNLTIGAYIDVKIYNFTLDISGFTGQNWRTFGTEQIISYNLAQDENLTSQIIITVPQNTSEKLHYVIEASTDKGFGKTAFYATNVITITYEELSDLYNKLLTNNTALQVDYNQLLTNYTTINQTYSSLLREYNATHTTCNLLNSSYESLKANYSSLKSNYDSLQEHFAYVEAKYDSSTGELSIVRYLMYVFGVTTVILAATTIYFRKKAPYIVVRKDTAAKQ
jgi:hypothetical protein